jgi:hypothetical protein
MNLARQIIQTGRIASQASALSPVVSMALATTEA